jgi:ABC-type dipeptide/oligopeptide/nickel transport system ATPase component
MTSSGVIGHRSGVTALFDNPQTDYTRELVEAVPHIGGEAAVAGV